MLRKYPRFRRRVVMGRNEDGDGQDYVEIPDNSETMLRFEENHNHLAHVLKRKLWQDYNGYQGRAQ